MLTTIFRSKNLKNLSYRAWPLLVARLSFLLALFNVLTLWDGLPVNNDSTIHLSIAPSSL